MKKFTLLFLLSVVLVQCSSKSDDILSPNDESALIINETNFNNTGFDVKVNEVQTKSINSESYVIAVNKGVNTPTQIWNADLISKDFGTILNLYDAEMNEIGTIVYDENSDIMYAYPMHRGTGEGYWNCVDRIWDYYVYLAENHQGILNKYLVKNFSMITDAVMIASAMYCCKDSAPCPNGEIGY